MRKKSNKLARLERQRYSIMVDDLDVCFRCGKPATDIHEVYGGRNRQQSMKYGFCVPLCRLCHSFIEQDVQTDFNLKWLVQCKFEENHTREEFIKIIGRNYEL